MRYSTELVVIFVAMIAGVHSAYLAFPRQGRSQQSATSSKCCPAGLKVEWAVGKQGLDFSYQTCSRDLPCCEGMEEIVRSKPNGMFYSMCIPACTDSYDYLRN